MTDLPRIPTPLGPGGQVSTQVPTSSLGLPGEETWLIIVYAKRNGRDRNSYRTTRELRRRIFLWCYRRLDSLACILARYKQA